MNIPITNEANINANPNEKNVELIYKEKQVNSVSYNVDDGRIMNEDSTKTKETILTELYRIKNNLFDYSSLSNYIHFYEIYTNLKRIVKYERSRKGTNLLFFCTTKKRYYFYLIYFFFLLLNICLLFRIQTLINFPFSYKYYYYYEINFHVFFTMFVLTYSILNICLFFFTFKALLHHINIMCLLIIQTLYNLYIKGKNKEIYKNTELLIEGCKNKYPYLDENFKNIILLHADHIFNKFTNIFKYINKENYKNNNIYDYQNCGNCSSPPYHYYEQDNSDLLVNLEEDHQQLDDYLKQQNNCLNQNQYVLTQKNYFNSNNLSNGLKYQQKNDNNNVSYCVCNRGICGTCRCNNGNDGGNKEGNNFTNKKCKYIVNTKQEDVYKKSKYNTNNNNDKKHCSCYNSTKKNIYNIYGNSIYSNIYDIKIYMKYKQNYIHTLMMNKCKEKINYIKFFFYFVPYIINVFINLTINFYVLCSVYYYNNVIPLAPPYDLANINISNILNYKGTYYIFFIFILNLIFLIYSLFLYKLNTIYFFLRHIYKECKYESIYYCEHVVNELYEQLLFEEIVKEIYEKKIKVKTDINFIDEKNETQVPNFLKTATHFENVNE
ncbi:conserved protein, unknown function [Hepatocystis sp. ex Piliocolobus tephrosceles]|nr:conserved protein, unknown function [Hepatocystis sp. ex Piliocolobus tephrosceles]